MMARHSNGRNKANFNQQTPHKVKLINSFCSPNKFLSVIEAISDEKKRVISTMGFGGLMQLACKEIRHELCHWLISNYNVAYHYIQLAKKSTRIPVTIEDVSQIMGIPASGIDVVLPKKRTFCKRTRKLNILEDNIRNLPVCDEFKKSFLIFACATIIAPSTKREGRHMLWDTIWDSDVNIPKNWAKLLFNSLGDGIRDYRENFPTYIRGSLVFLQLLYMVKCYIPSIMPQKMPLCAGWTDELIKKRLAEEVKLFKGYGHLEVTSKHGINSRKKEYAHASKSSHPSKPAQDTIKQFFNSIKSDLHNLMSEMEEEHLQPHCSSLPHHVSDPQSVEKQRGNAHISPLSSPSPPHHSLAAHSGDPQCSGLPTLPTSVINHNALSSHKNVAPPSERTYQMKRKRIVKPLPTFDQVYVVRRNGVDQECELLSVFHNLEAHIEQENFEEDLTGEEIKGCKNGEGKDLKNSQDNTMKENPSVSTTGKQSENDSDEDKSEVLKKTRFSEPAVDFKGVKSIEDFAIVVNGLVINSELPKHIHTKYYELCCSQKTYLHDHLIDGLNDKLAAGIISETVSIADAIRASKLTTPTDKFCNWNQTLKGLQEMGMKVGFLRARLEQLMSLGFEANRKKEARLERISAEEKIRDLEASLLHVKEVKRRLDAEIEALNSPDEKQELMFQQLVEAPW